MFQQEINKQRKTRTLEQNQVFWARESLLSTNNRSGKETPLEKIPDKPLKHTVGQRSWFDPNSKQHGTWSSGELKTKKSQQ